MANNVHDVVISTSKYPILECYVLSVNSSNLEELTCKWGILLASIILFYSSVESQVLLLDCPIVWS